jgi:peptidoglycan-N-acetylglucosamine deacetylase
MQKKPVFFDPSGRRAGRVAGLAWAFVLVSVALGIGFIISIATVTPPDTGLLSFFQSHLHRVPDVKLAAPALLKPADQLAAQVRASEATRTVGRMRSAMASCCAPTSTSCSTWAT